MFRKKDPIMEEVYNREYRKALKGEIRDKAIKDAQVRAREGGKIKRMGKATGKAVWKYMSTPPPKRKKKQSMW